MALETITIKDAANADKDILVDDNGSSDFIQVMKLMTGADGTLEFVSQGQKTMSASLPVTIASDQTAIPAPTSGTASGSITGSAQSVTLTLAGGVSAVAVQVSGTFVATLQLEATVDDSVWVAAFAYDSGGGNVLISTTGTGLFTIPASGYKKVRVRSSAYSSGTASVAMAGGVGGTPSILGISPGAAATNLGKAEDLVHTHGDVGVMALAVRNDAAATSFSSTDGDYTPIAVTAKGELFVSKVSQLVPGTAAADLGKAEDAPHSSGDTGVMVLGVRNDASVVSTADGDYGAMTIDSAGRLRVVVEGLAPGSTSTLLGKTEDSAHSSGDVGIMSLGVRADSLAAVAGTTGDYAPLLINDEGALWATLSTSTSGGWTSSMTISAASTNATSVKGSAGQVGFIYCSNINAAVRYLKIYNKATSPTVGTDTPVAVFAIPGNTAGGGFFTNFGPGIELGTGIAFALTTGVATSDTGAVAANDIVVTLGYH